MSVEASVNCEARPFTHHLIEFSQGVTTSALWKIHQMEDQLKEAERIREHQVKVIRELRDKYEASRRSLNHLYELGLKGVNASDPRDVFPPLIKLLIEAGWADDAWRALGDKVTKDCIVYVEQMHENLKHFARTALSDAEMAQEKRRQEEAQNLFKIPAIPPEHVNCRSVIG